MDWCCSEKLEYLSPACCVLPGFEPIIICTPVGFSTTELLGNSWRAKPFRVPWEASYKLRGLAMLNVPCKVFKERRTVNLSSANLMKWYVIVEYWFQSSWREHRTDRCSEHSIKTISNCYDSMLGNCDAPAVSSYYNPLKLFSLH